MPENIRNFCILAHIDHGKSTLADRFLELTKTIAPEKFQPQFLDTNPISRERGITIKLAPVRMSYQLEDQKYNLNLIDTPGHVDFSYEVSRSLAACEGAILLVDAVKGIQAQSLSYCQQAHQQGLKIIPVVNKIDLPAATPEEIALSMTKTFGFKENEIVFISAKTGEGTKELLEKIIKVIPPPKESAKKKLRCLIFDSFYDSHKGVIAAVKVVDGGVEKEKGLSLMASQAKFKPFETGYFCPELKASSFLENGAVGYIATGLKDIKLVRVGDTITESASRELQPLAGYQQPKPMVFAGIYPIDQNDYKNLNEALGKLQLNDASLVFHQENSQALGKGFRVGFLGPLHSEIVLDRLEREFDLQLITTAPQVVYELKQKGERRQIEDPAKLPDDYQQLMEPIVEVVIFTPEKYLGEILELCRKKRGKFINMTEIGRVTKIEQRLPLSEIIVDFFAQLKSLSSGFASYDYSFLAYQAFDGVKLEVIISGQKLAALSVITPRAKAYQEAKKLVDRLAKAIPRQLFEVIIQVAIGSRVIARASLPAFRKDVTAKLYGGDQTRKDKLLKKQKKGKQKMKAVGKVMIPQEAFLAVLKRD